MNKLVIANVGKSSQGKSTSIKEVLSYLIKNGAVELDKTRLGSFDEDIRMIVTYRGVKIGIESQGDPNSRIFNSLPYFVEQKCYIIVCTCRTYGKTYNAVDNLSNKGYNIMYSSNPVFEYDGNFHIYDVINKDYAKMVKNFIDERIDGVL